MRTLSLITALAAAGLLAACGGSPSSGSDTGNNNNGGGNNGGNNGGSTGITLTGVVAKGAALAGASVTAKCASGTVTPVTAAANGSYTLTIADGTLPCVLQATGIGADAALVLHSVATGSGTVTANITPLTQLLVAQLSGQDPAAFMAATPAANLGTQITGTTVTTAQTAVLATLEAAGVDTSAITNVVSGALVAASGGNTGNGYDLVLDHLATALTTAGSTLAQLTQTVADTSAAGQGGGAQPAEANPLPADLLLRPHASNCTALRSTDYRLIKLTRSLNLGEDQPVTGVESMTVNAADLSVSFPGEAPMALTPNGDCRYTLPEGEAVVAPSGVMVVRHWIGTDDDTVNAGDRGSYRLMIGLPVQNLGLADIAGSWNFLGADRSAPILPFNGKMTVAANGSTSGDACWDDPMDTPEANCSVSPAGSSVVTAHGNASFTVGSTDVSDPWSDRVFAFRAGNGEVMLVIINANGGVGIGTRQRTLALPAVGDASRIFSAIGDANLVATEAVSGNDHTIASVSGSTVVRNTAVVGNSVTHPQTLVYNSVRNGYLHRLGGPVTASDSSTVTVREMYALPIAGTGLTVFFLPNTLGSGSNARFGLSVRQ